MLLLAKFQCHIDGAAVRRRRIGLRQQNFDQTLAHHSLILSFRITFEIFEILKG